MMQQNKFLILYGSQTGQAEAISEEIADNAEKINLKSERFCLNDINRKFDFEGHPVVVIVASTTGDGEPPANSLRFLRRVRSAKSLSHVRFAVLALGDTNYTSFCNFGRTCDEQMFKLGAKRICPTGFADDAVGLETVVEPWIDNLFSILPNVLGETFVDNLTDRLEKIDTNENPIEDEEIEENWNIDKSVNSIVYGNETLRTSNLTVPALPAEFLSIKFIETEDDYDNEIAHSQNNAPPNLMEGSVVNCEVTDAVELTSPDAVKMAIMLDITLSENSEFEPGDSFGIFCQNEATEVDRILERLNIADKADDICELAVKEGTTKRRAAVPAFIPVRSTPRDILTYCCDIRSPSKGFLRAIVELAKNKEQKRRLQELCSRQGNDEYMNYVRQMSLSVLDILMHFPSVKISFERLIEHLPRLMPRPYSVCNSPLKNSSKIQIVFNVVKIDLGDGRLYNRNGVFTGWIEHLTRAMRLGRKQTFKLRIFKRKSTSFRLPQEIDKPIIMIGPGTGVAPFIGFLDHLEKKENSHLNIRWLFFGCRNREKDFLFKNSITTFLNRKILTNLNVAYSREIDHEYVQDQLKKEGSELSKLIINKDAIIYVCGDAKNMSKDVNSAFSQVLADNSDMDLESAGKFLMQMRLHHRYHEDVW